MAEPQAALIEDFAARVVEENPMHANFLAASLQAMSGKTRADMAQYLAYCLARGLSLDYVVDCYNTITLDSQIEQIYFKRNGKYRCSTFAEVADRVYFDPEYMKKYMYGLALTSFLWPNHAAIHDFFLRTFPKGVGGTYLEIGPGHGYYFMKAAALGNFERMLGVDISATSVALTRDIVDYFGIGARARVEIVERDFLATEESPGPLSCVVMGEVLEHVEQPGIFLEAIARLSDAKTHIYVTTCLNAPAVDHIYLFKNEAQLEALIGASGLAIVESIYAPYAGKSLEECWREALPVNVAFVLRKP